MPYRWSYRAEQEAFRDAEFGRIGYAGPDREARDQAGRELMEYFNAFLPKLGVTPETISTVETAHGDLLDVLEIRFQSHPYLPGGRPSVADIGFMAPLFAHLACDPVAATLMKSRAPNVYRWTERMNVASIADGECSYFPETRPENDVIPATLEPLLGLVFRDWGVELAANAALYNAWTADNPSLPARHMVSEDASRMVHPTLGYIDYVRRGCAIHRASAPQSLWHFDKAAA